MNNLSSHSQERKEIFKSLNQLMKKVINSIYLLVTKLSHYTQTSEADLTWGPEHYIGISNYSEVKKDDTFLITQKDSFKQSNNLEAVRENNQIFPKFIGQSNTTPLQHGFDTTINTVIKNIHSNWSIPTNILLFLSNSINEQTEGRVLPWSHLKKEIYEIYYLRIYHATEIYGSTNSSFTSLEDLILIYFFIKYKLRRLAEINLTIFITSLKYYIVLWPRAKTFAQLAGFIKYSEINQKIEPGEETVDIYLQDYFTSCLAVLNKDKSALVESKEGNTFIDIHHIEKVINHLMPWIDCEKDKNQVIMTIKKLGKCKDSNELFDLDITLSVLINEYQIMRNQLQKKLINMYNKQTQSNNNVFSFDEFQDFIQQLKYPIMDSPFLFFPSKISVARALISSHLLSNNSYSLNIQSFLKSCIKFGIDCPFPTIGTRIYSFGSIKEIESIIAKCLIGNSNPLININNSPTKMNSIKNPEQSNLESNFSQKIEKDKDIVNYSSNIICQHFSILNDLQIKLNEYKIQLDKEDWLLSKNVFGEIFEIVEKGCNALKFGFIVV